jgi:hypothetical protein
MSPALSLVYEQKENTNTLQWLKHIMLGLNKTNENMDL